MEAELLAVALGGIRAGRGWMVKCPAHEDRTPSLSVRTGRDGRTLVHCHAGCSQTTVIEALKARGLWGRAGQGTVGPEPLLGNEKEEDGARTRAALRLWEQGQDLTGTPGFAYLRSRGLNGTSLGRLRFHPALKHPSGLCWPGLVALVTRGRDDVPGAVHRTFLQPDGSGKAPVEPAKMMLGPCAGGAVRLKEARDSIVIAEGLETAASVMEAVGIPAWAALSASGLRCLDLPDTIRDVIIAADGDDAGERAACAAARRWAREGRRVRIARAPAGFDFNDVLQCPGSDLEGVA